jgi:mxaJ protein
MKRPYLVTFPAVAAFGALAWAGTPSTELLRVCADPNNMPYSDAREEGFENRIAAILADDLGATVEYTWWPQRRGFLKKTLKAGACDVVIGLPTDTEGVAKTRPYYTSSFLFLSRADADPPTAGSQGPIRSFDDPRLRDARIGVQVVGDDYANPPAAFALSSRGIVDNVVGYSVYGDYARPDPAAPIVAAVDQGEVDVAVVWGPQAGWYARHAVHPLVSAPVTPDPDGPLPFHFSFAVAVRKDDTALRDRLQDALDRRKPEIDAALDAYGVPR